MVVPVTTHFKLIIYDIHFSHNGIATTVTAYQQVSDDQKVYEHNHTQEDPSLPAPQPHSGQEMEVWFHPACPKVSAMIYLGSFLVSGFVPHELCLGVLVRCLCRM